MSQRTSSAGRPSTDTSWSPASTPASAAFALVAWTTATPAMIDVRTGSCGPDRGETSDDIERKIATIAQAAARPPVI